MVAPNVMFNEAEAIARDLIGADPAIIEVMLDDEAYDLWRTMKAEGWSDRHTGNCLRMFRQHALNTLGRIERKRREAARR